MIYTIPVGRWEGVATHAVDDAQAGDVIVAPDEIIRCVVTSALRMKRPEVVERVRVVTKEEHEQETKETAETKVEPTSGDGATV